MRDIYVHPLSALRDNYIWVVVNTHSHAAVVVDPGEAAVVMAFLESEQLQLHGILITHNHWDHVHGVAELLNHYPVPVIAGIHCTYPQVTRHIGEGEVLELPAGLPTYTVLAIPGHTSDHIAYYDQTYLFCGDTLFAGGCGRLFEGTAPTMYASLQKIAALPADTAICCAHEYTLANLRFAQLVEPSNDYIRQRIASVAQLRQQGLPSLPSQLAEEKHSNPFLRCATPVVWQQVALHCQRSLVDPTEVFTELRKWKDTFA